MARAKYLGEDPEFFKKHLGRGGFVPYRPRPTEDSKDTSNQPVKDQPDTSSTETPDSP